MKTALIFYLNFVVHNCNHHVERLTSNFVWSRTSRNKYGCFVGILIGPRAAMSTITSAIDLSGTFGFL